MKIIGYLIGGALLTLVFLGPGTGWYLASKDTFAALHYDGVEQAEIIDCTSIRSGGQNSRYVRVPIVRRPSGKTLSGSVDEIRYFWECDDQIGTSVEVVYDIDHPDKAKLNTFIEMWFLPILIGVICLIWYSAIVIGYIKKYRHRKKR